MEKLVQHRPHSPLYKPKTNSFLSNKYHIVDQQTCFVQNFEGNNHLWTLETVVEGNLWAKNLHFGFL